MAEMNDEAQVPATGTTVAPPMHTDRTLGELHDASVAPQAPVTADAIGAATPGEVPQDVGAFASDLHKYLQQNVTWADTKAAFLFAASGGLLAYLNNQGATKKIIPHVFDIPNTLSNTVGMIAFSAFVVAACAAFATFWPRTGGNAEGIVFWKAIATKFTAADTFADAIFSRSPRALAEEKLHHCWELANVCRRKFKWANVATYAFAAGSIATLLYVAVWL
jgi:hypothetical protein